MKDGQGLDKSLGRMEREDRSDLGDVQEETSGFNHGPDMWIKREG